jgi:hypothetical protein
LVALGLNTRHISGEQLRDLRPIEIAALKVSLDERQAQRK